MMLNVLQPMVLHLISFNIIHLTINNQQQSLACCCNTDSTASFKICRLGAMPRLGPAVSWDGERRLVAINDGWWLVNVC